MRKATTIIVIVAVLAVMTFGTATMAQELKRVRGSITKIDMETSSVTIHPEGGIAVTVAMGNAESVSKFKVGDTVESRYVIEDGKNVGKRLRRVSEGCE